MGLHRLVPSALVLVALGCGQQDGPRILVTVLGVPAQTMQLEADFRLGVRTAMAPQIWNAPSGGFGVETSFVVVLPRDATDLFVVTVWARDLAGCAIASGSASRPVMDNARLDLTIALRATAPMCPDAGARDGSVDARAPDASVDARGFDVIPQCNMPGQRVCAGGGASGTCDDTGNIVIDRTCPPGSACAAGYCQPPTGGQPCLSIEDCNGGAVCDLYVVAGSIVGRCTSPAPGGGLFAPCTMDSQCQTLICANHNGVRECLFPCTANSQCALVNGTCVGVQSPLALEGVPTTGTRFCVR